MIDLHCHILPGLDDGAPDLETACAMAALAVQSGVTEMAATPHWNPFHPLQSQTIRQAALTLQAALRDRKIPLRLHTGAEILALPGMDCTRLPTLAGSAYTLVEFPFDLPLAEMERLLRAVAREGYRPLVAHPERYDAIQRQPEAAVRWFREGCLLQLNKGSLLGRFGPASRAAAEALLSMGLIHIMASDGHRANARTPHMGDAVRALTDGFGPACRQLLLEDNPARILAGQTVVPPELFRPDGPS